MKAFLTILLIAAFLIATAGALWWFDLQPELARAPAIVILPQIIAAELAFLLGLLTLAVCVGFLCVLAAVDRAYHPSMAPDLPGGVSQWAIEAVAREEAKNAARDAAGGRR